MGCGKKAAYEDEMDEIYKVELAKIRSTTTDKLLSTIKDIERLSKLLIDADLALTIYQHEVLGSIHKLAKGILK